MSGMTKTILNAIIHYVPILLGAVVVYSAIFRYPKPPVKLYLRLIYGLIGAVLLYSGIEVLLNSK
ncbi:MAG TPA: hypothetical protein VGR03_10985 [Candidatus Acidoferrum sp.]|nr:hypothetical protein [Candidatus Acidoferrum sp.]